VQTHIVVHGLAEEPIGIVGAQVVLGGEGQLDDVGRRVEIVRGEAQRAQAAGIERGAQAGGDGAFQAFGLQLLKRFAGQALCGFVVHLPPW
jgi:hypothetical protein